MVSQQGTEAHRQVRLNLMLEHNHRPGAVRRPVSHAPIAIVIELDGPVAGEGATLLEDISDVLGTLRAQEGGFVVAQRAVDARLP
jgi:hypothetical protein